MLQRVNLETMVLALKDNHQAAVTIPAGTTVDVVDSEDDRFVVVTVGGEQFHAFASDLADPIGRSDTKRIGPGNRLTHQKRKE